MNLNLPEKIKTRLYDAGWSEKRKVNYYEDSLPDVYLFSEAKRILESFFGLQIPGLKKGKHFSPPSLHFHPLEADILSEVLLKMSEKFNKHFYPLADMGDGHAALVMDEAGACYSYFGPLVLHGNTFEEGLVSLMEGRRRKGFSGRRITI